MKGVPWENRLVYIRMSFVFVYPIDGHRIVEYTHLIGTVAQPPSSATWSYLSLILSLIEFRNIRYSNRPRKFGTQNTRVSRSIRASSTTYTRIATTYTRIAQRLSPTYLFCTISFTRRSFESNGTRIDRKWSIPLDSSTISSRIRVPLGDSIVFTSSLLF